MTAAPTAPAPAPPPEQKNRPLGAFFLVVLALSIPFWVAEPFARALFGELPIQLPLSALMAFLPAIVALVFVWRGEGRAAAGRLFARAVDVGRMKTLWWIIPAALGFPAILFLSWLTMIALGLPLPALQAPPPTMIPIFVVFFLGAVGEELGWSGYVLDPMQDRWGALRAAVLLGLFWTGWHVIPFIQTGRSAEWVVWHAAGLVPTRVLMVWLYNAAGRSVFASVLFHAMSNVAFFLFPTLGSHYDPRVTTPILVVAAVGVVWARRVH